jgi:hypothetical protein
MGFRISTRSKTVELLIQNILWFVSSEKMVLLKHVAIATAVGFLLVVLVVNNSSPRQWLQHSSILDQTSRKAREIQLASLSMLPAADSPAESARCVGLLHACQSWLELKDGVSNDIVITSPGQSFCPHHEYNVIQMSTYR